MKHIVHILSYTWENGGVSKVVYDLAKYESEKGNKVTIYSQANPAHKLYKEIPDVNIIQYPISPFSRILALYSSKMWKELKRIKSDVDVLHIHALWNFVPLAAYLLGYEKKSLITIHGTLHPYTFKGQWLKKGLFSILFQKRFLKHVKINHVLHIGEKKELEDYVGEKLNNITVVPNGIDLPKEEPIVQNRKNDILFLGRLHQKKGLDLLLPAFLEVLKEVPDAKLILAGPDFGMMGFAKQFVIENSISEKVAILGAVHGQQKINLLKNSKVFTLPSYSEGFSIAVLEALSYKLPVVASSETGLSPEIKEFDAGIICELNVKSLADALIKTLKSSNNQMGENGYKLVSERFETNIVCKEFSDKIYSKF